MAVLEARVTKVVRDEATGWYTIETDGEPKKLATKNEGPANDAAAIRRDGTLATLTYTQRDRRDGDRVYHNYYLDKAEVSRGRRDDGIDVVNTAETTRKTAPTDAWRMCLNKGGELAVLTMPLMPVEQRDFDTQKRIAVAWARFFFFSPVPSADQPSGLGETPSGARRGAYNDDSYELPPPPQDDDIPF
jgi:hypothetical protein